jgi:ABC-type phosphate transport system substrate-binding protein
MLFDFMINLGPNAQTSLLAGEVFPTRLRGMGAGFAAAFGKVGAVATAFRGAEPRHPAAAPLINYEYVVVSRRQADPQVAAALRRFLLWTVSPEGGNAAKYLDAVGFIPLPDFIRALSENPINRIE